MRAGRARAAETTAYTSAEEERQNRLLSMMESAGGGATLAMAGLEGEKGRVKSDFWGDIGSMIGAERGKAESKSILDRILGDEDEGGDEGAAGTAGQETETDPLALARAVAPQADTSVPEEGRLDLRSSIRRRPRRSLGEGLGYREVPDYLARLEEDEGLPPGWGRRRRRRLTV